MTVIAWDGTTLAADKQCTDNGSAHTVTKIFRVPGGLAGLIGNAAHAMQLLKWLRAGQNYTFPPPALQDDFATVLFIAEDGEIRVYSGNGGGAYEVYEDQYTAAGCGRDFALAAMHLGKTAREAVAVACALDIHCGQGIDTLTLD